MESLHILRNHLNDHRTSFTADIDVFSTILNDIEKQLSIDLKDGNNELHYDQYIAQCIDLESRDATEKTMKIFFSSIGLDGCGKSTLGNELHDQLSKRKQKSRLLYTPPDELRPFRAYFDSQPESVRRAYYDLGNMIVSFELKNHPDTITILDRYWPSTIAYKLAKTNDDKPINLSWPKYLVQPALIAYIYVDEAERCRRIAQRSIDVTVEEKQLAAQEALRRRLDSIYRNNIPSTHLHAIDGNRSISDIAKDILNLFEEQNKKIE